MTGSLEILETVIVAAGVILIVSGTAHAVRVADFSDVIARHGVLGWGPVGRLTLAGAVAAFEIWLGAGSLWAVTADHASGIIRIVHLGFWALMSAYVLAAARKADFADCGCGVEEPIARVGALRPALIGGVILVSGAASAPIPVVLAVPISIALSVIAMTWTVGWSTTAALKAELEASHGLSSLQALP